MHHRGRSRFGSAESGAFTLIELLVVMVISGIVMLYLVVGLYEHALLLQNRLNLQKTNLLAEDLMLEIMSKNFADPQTPGTFGPEESAPRKNYDDVDDYDGLSNSPPQTIEGTIQTQYNDFTVLAFVENVNPDDLNTDTPQPDGSTGFKRITVVIQKGKYETTIVKGKPVVLSTPEIVITNRSVVSQYE